MNWYFVALPLLAILCGGGGAAHSRNRAAASGCPALLTRSDSSAEFGFVRIIVTNIQAHPRDVWGHTRFSPGDTLAVAIVRDDSKCAQALHLLKSFFTDTSRIPAVLRLAHVGHYYIGQGGRIAGNEFQPIFVFDEALTKVIYPCADGLPCN